MTSISGVSFSEAWERRICDSIEGSSMTFVDRLTLLANKAAAGRPKDLADIDALSKPGPADA